MVIAFIANWQPCLKVTNKSNKTNTRKGIYFIRKEQQKIETEKKTIKSTKTIN